MEREGFCDECNRWFPVGEENVEEYDSVMEGSWVTVECTRCPKCDSPVVLSMN